MKLSVLVLLALSAALSTATAAQAWVDGVTQTSGWYDANKANPSAKDGDNDLCWAASASNLIAWWQDKYSTPAEIPTDIDDIWSTFKNRVAADEGGDTHAAFQWWLTGVYVPTTDAERFRSIFSKDTYSTLPSWAGYYYSEYGDELGYTYNPITQKWESTLSDFLCVDYRNSFTSDNIVSLVLQGCGVGLGVTDDAASFGHAITLWGLEYDSNTNAISRMWLTDSDDAQYNFGQDGLFVVDVTTREDRLYIDTPDSNWYTEKENVYISNLFAVNPAVSTEWGIPLAVPEPGTATLSLLGLTGLLTRRRRK